MKCTSGPNKSKISLFYILVWTLHCHRLCSQGIWLASDYVMLKNTSRPFLFIFRDLLSLSVSFVLNRSQDGILECALQVRRVFVETRCGPCSKKGILFSALKASVAVSRKLVLSLSGFFCALSHHAIVSRCRWDFRHTVHLFCVLLRDSRLSQVTG